MKEARTQRIQTFAAGRLVLVFLVLAMAHVTALADQSAANDFAFAQKTNDAQQTAAAKAAVAKIGARTSSLVQVKRRGKPKVNGSISEIREDDFVVISSDKGVMGLVINIRYDEVVSIKGRGIDWRNAGAKASVFGLKALKVMAVILKGVNPQFPP